MNLGKLLADMDGMTIIVIANVESVREYKSKRGTMGFLLLKDQYAEVEMVVFAKVYEENRELLLSGEPLVVTAKVDGSSEAVTLVAESVKPT